MDAPNSDGLGMAPVSHGVVALVGEEKKNKKEKDRSGIRLQKSTKNMIVC